PKEAAIGGAQGIKVLAPHIDRVSGNRRSGNIAASLKVCAPNLPARLPVQCEDGAAPTHIYNILQNGRRVGDGAEIGGCKAPLLRPGQLVYRHAARAVRDIDYIPIYRRRGGNGSAFFSAPNRPEEHPSDLQSLL